MNLSLAPSSTVASPRRRMTPTVPSTSYSSLSSVQQFVQWDDPRRVAESKSWLARYDNTVPLRPATLETCVDAVQISARPVAQNAEIFIVIHSYLSDRADLVAGHVEIQNIVSETGPCACSSCDGIRHGNRKRGNACTLCPLNREVDASMLSIHGHMACPRRSVWMLI